MRGWSEAAHGTLAQRLASAVRGAIAAGLLGDGIPLPPERLLAESLAVSRSTVTALDELRAEGLVESRRGSGSVLRSAQRPAPRRREPHRGALLGMVGRQSGHRQPT